MEHGSRPDERLVGRVGRLHLQQRLGIEHEHVTQIFGRGRNFFHIENWYSVHALIRLALRISGMYGRGRRNAADIRLQHNGVVIDGLPEGLSGYTILQLSDLHVDMQPAILDALLERVEGLQYDLCVLTGDFRARTYGPYDAVLDGMTRLKAALSGPVLGVLGNHDFIEMVPELEALGIRMLLNESLAIEHEGAVLHVAGVDDPHYYQVDNLEKAAAEIPEGAVSVLLSHSPEIYRRAAHAGFRLMLCGHTHVGQICLPGGYALTYNIDAPRWLGRGAWQHHTMQGYTSSGCGSCVVDARFNCPPEVTLHTLQSN